MQRGQIEENALHFRTEAHSARGIGHLRRGTHSRQRQDRPQEMGQCSHQGIRESRIVRSCKQDPNNTNDSIPTKTVHHTWSSSTPSFWRFPSFWSINTISLVRHCQSPHLHCWPALPASRQLPVATTRWQGDRQHLHLKSQQHP